MTLNELNFSKLIQLNLTDVNRYSVSDYFDNDKRHPKVTSYCTCCEDKGIKVCGNSEYTLQNISHGSCSKDFLQAISPRYSIDNWNSSGVVFIMESPSKDYGIYEDVSIVKNGKQYKKRPSKLWYWVHDKMNVSGYPQFFKGLTYGELIASAIVTFKLSNAYLTNLIKCGLYNVSNDGYKGVDHYDQQCIDLCIKEYLEREIDLIKPKVIFTFGSKVYQKVTSSLSSLIKRDRIKVIGLPHPAGRQRGFKDEYYNVLYFCMMAKWLYVQGVISKDFYSELMLRFVDDK